MPPSQLKQLKASLRDSGVLGPQQSKKQKRQNAQSGANVQNRIKRNAALQAIRDRFNPFEIKAPASRGKFDVTTRDNKGATAPRVRPGVTKSLGEERRRATLLQEMNKKNKTGGILDRRFGENDPTMTPEERAAERFARESQRKLRKDSMFNLEEDEEEFQLTHGGQSLTFDGVNLDDFQDRELEEDDDEMSDGEMSRKRKRIFNEDGELEEVPEKEGDEQPDRKKSKNEVMKELIAKSKFYKHERQQAKEDDDDLREELDKELPDLFAMLRGVPAPAKPANDKKDLESMNPERAALIEGNSKEHADKEYDQQLKQLTFDKRSKPTDRTKTEEEKAEEEAQRLKTLEEERLRRMRGEELDDSDEEQEDKEEEEEEEDDDDDGSDDESIPDDALAFGLRQTTTRPELGVEDEDDFIIDDDLVETRSDVSLSFIESDEDMSGEEPGESSEEEEEEDELINGFTTPAQGDEDANPSGIAFTFPCPEDHESFLQILEKVAVEDLPTVIQRIRALHHPRLHSDNKAKLGRFSAILVQHVAYLANQPEHPPFAILENILRHIHSMSKVYPDKVAMAFRDHLREMSISRPLNPLPGDLIILTGVSTIFPTSDHFHAVATPAHLSIARYLEQGSVDTLADISIGAYAASLCLQYQMISKRYIPEFMNYVLNALCNLSPEEPSKSLGFFPLRKPQESLRLTSKSAKHRKMQFWDILGSESKEELKVALIATFVSLLNSAAELWAAKSAFAEIFTPALRLLKHLKKSSKGKQLPSDVQDSLQVTLDKLEQLLSQARSNRRPLLLHNHRPLAIKTSIPKFEENFNPDKHYDPDRERAESNRLRAEYKREHKGAMRELRKDANFIAREKLREKKERDAEYEKKYKRLVAEIQNEEGREANAYERERKMRKGKR
ncbi:hypothetical protein ASPZODRAFT_133323 [Penicilliopsis zonata CBS 506.65]|uniref:Nop14-like family protein n=1 Tax=Penicilliopsis zonata CBS 506.65 TaxID=1073090 RepID=A0A1L9SGJ5_9EURO|nr:hypothetical protein ASPZODRAFT_133323 [Penicilliopsis zonata CBS 506.65]OJJ46292.1 hypothetical protein ASPZODRAFT_133323 [Penicilliopsis zonata CBS 506.65]